MMWEHELLVEAVSLSYWVLSHSLGNTGRAMICPFIALSIVIIRNASVHQLITTALSHWKHICLTAVSCLCVCVSVVPMPITCYN